MGYERDVRAMTMSGNELLNTLTTPGGRLVANQLISAGTHNATQAWLVADVLETNQRRRRTHSQTMRELRATGLNWSHAPTLELQFRLANQGVSLMGAQFEYQNIRANQMQSGADSAFK